MTKKYIIGNWKMQPESWAEAEGILDATSRYFESVPQTETSVVVCPPFVFVEEVSKVLKTTSLGSRVELGAQDIALSEASALTGEVSGAMLAKLGTRYVIIGHSERRWKLNESDEVVNQKLKMALENELTPIVCIGERERDENYKEFLKQQIKATFAGLSADEIAKCLIAYEPVWAISTNPNARPDTPEAALESISVIREVLSKNYKLETSHFLYGGSVNSKNVKKFISLNDISGVLVGSASVNKEEFVKILKEL